MIDRRLVYAKDAALAIGEGEVAETLSNIDRGTVEDLLEYALLSLAFTTGDGPVSLLVPPGAIFASKDVTRLKNAYYLAAHEGKKQMRYEIEPRTRGPLLAYCMLSMAQTGECCP